MTPEEEVNFQQSTICWLCEALLCSSVDKSCESPLNDEKIRVHDQEQENTDEQLIGSIGVIQIISKSNHILFLHFSTTFLVLIGYNHLFLNN